MKALLKIIVSFNTLGVNIFKSKTLTKWLSELSQKFHFLPLYWQPVYSYGQTSTSQTLLRSQQHLKTRHYAFQEVSTTQSVSDSKTNTTSLNLEVEVKTGRLHVLTESLKFEGFLLR